MIAASLRLESECLPRGKQVFDTLLVISGPSNFLDEETTEKRLKEARLKLDRIQSGQHVVRGKEKRMESLKASIAALEFKLLQARNTASDSTVGQSAVARGSGQSALQIMQSTLSASGPSSTTYTPIEVKKEQMEIIVPHTGSGSEQHPMEIDTEVTGSYSRCLA